VIAVKPSGRKVALVLQKSEEADATIDVLEADYPNVAIVDHMTYWQIESDDEIYVDMERVGQELGRDITLSEWLVIMTTFVGRAAPGVDHFRVTSKMLELEVDPDEPAR
jgi:hypothetical protein